MRLRICGKAHRAKRAFDILLRPASALMSRRALSLCFAAMIGGLFAVSSPAAPSIAFAQGETAAFLAAIEEVPLMAGLTEEPTVALDFDKPHGRLVETYAYGEVRAEDAAAFYHAVMPEFGWQVISGLVFSREGEMLRIDLIAEERSLVVRFVLSPNSSQ